MAFTLTAQLKLQNPANLNQVINQIKSQLAGVNLTINVKNSRQLQDLNTQLTDINKNAKASSSSVTKFGEQAALAAKRFFAFSIATTAFIKLVSAIQSGIGDAIAFEREVFKIAQVSGLAVRDMKDLTDEVTRLSTSLGVSSGKLLSVAQVLAQAGLSAEDTKKSLDALAKSDLSPTFDNMANTAEGVIAIMAQFNVSADQLETKLGSINSVAAKFAVESSDLITTVRRTGGAFKAAGGSLEELIALFTSVRSTTRESAESIATGFRTIFTRLQRIRTVNFLEGIGIQLRDFEGQFIGPYEAIRELSKALKEIPSTDPRFSKIIEELGGFRQVSKVIPLIQEFSKAEQALVVAQQGQGSLARDAAQAQGSLAVQIAKVREEFDALIRKIAGNSSFERFTNAAVAMASALIKIADAATPLLPFIAALGTLKFGSALPNFFSSFVGKGGLGFNEGGPVHKFASGGLVPGTGNRDTVSARLTPGEFVIRKQAVKDIGVDRLAAMSRGYKFGGRVDELTNEDYDSIQSILAKNTSYNSVFASKRSDKGTALNSLVGHITDPKERRTYYEVARARYQKIKSTKGEESKTAKTKTNKLQEELYSRIPSSDREFGAIYLNPIGEHKERTSPLGIQLKYKDQNVPFKLDYKEANISQTGADEFKKHFEAVLPQVVQDLASKIAPSFGSPEKPTLLRRVPGQESIAGNLFEGALFSLGAPYKEPLNAEEDRRTFDFPKGLGNLSDIFGGSISKNRPVDAKLTFGTQDQSLRDKAKAYYETNYKFIQKKALGGVIQKFADGGPVNSLTGIFDSDMIEGGTKVKDALLQLILSGNKPFKLIHGVAGSGKTTLATKQYGTNFVRNPQDINRYSDFVVLSGASKNKKGEYSEVVQNLFKKASHITGLAPNKDRVQSQRSKRAELAELGNLPDMRSVAQLKGTSFAPADPDLDFYDILKKSGKKIEVLTQYATGGSVGTDTVPALLTPGEFVFTKEASQRIGYNNLNRMNKGVQKFAKGGPVKFASGGQTFAQKIGNIGVDGQIVGLLFGLNTLASSFTDLDSSVAQAVTSLTSLGTRFATVNALVNQFGNSLTDKDKIREKIVKKQEDLLNTSGGAAAKQAIEKADRNVEIARKAREGTKISLRAANGNIINTNVAQARLAFANQAKQNDPEYQYNVSQIRKFGEGNIPVLSGGLSGKSKRQSGTIYAGTDRIQTVEAQTKTAQLVFQARKDKALKALKETEIRNQSAYNEEAEKRLVASRKYNDANERLNNVTTTSRIAKTQNVSKVPLTPEQIDKAAEVEQQKQQRRQLIAIGSIAVAGTAGQFITDRNNKAIAQGKGSKEVAGLGGALSGAAAGATLGLALGGPLAPFTAAIGAAAGGTYGYITAVQEASKAIEKVAFDKIFNKFTQKLSRNDASISDINSFASEASTRLLTSSGDDFTTALGQVEGTAVGLDSKFKDFINTLAKGTNSSSDVLDKFYKSVKTDTIAVFAQSIGKTTKEVKDEFKKLSESAVKNEKLQARLASATKKVADRMSELVVVMGGISRSNFELDQFSAKLNDISNFGVSGNRSSKLSAAIDSPLSFDSSEIQSELSNVLSNLGSAGGKLKTDFNNTFNIIKRIPEVLSGLETGSLKDPVQEIADAFGPIPPIIKEAIIESLSQLQGDGTDSTAIAKKLQTDFKGVSNQLIEVVKQVGGIDIVKSAIDNFNKAVQTQADGLNKLADLQKARVELLTRTIDIEDQFTSNLDELGYKIQRIGPTSDVKKQEAILGTSSPLINNAQGLGQQAIQSFLSLQNERNKPTSDPFAQSQFSQSLTTAVQGLEYLANYSARAADPLKKISELRTKRSEAQSFVANAFGGGGTSLRETNKNLRLLDIAQQGNLSQVAPQDQIQLLQFLQTNREAAVSTLGGEANLQAFITSVSKQLLTGPGAVLSGGQGSASEKFLQEILKNLGNQPVELQQLAALNTIAAQSTQAVTQLQNLNAVQSNLTAVQTNFAVPISNAQGQVAQGKANVAEAQIRKNEADKNRDVLEEQARKVARLQSLVGTNNVAAVVAAQQAGTLQNATSADQLRDNRDRLVENAAKFTPSISSTAAYVNFAKINLDPNKDPRAEAADIAQKRLAALGATAGDLKEFSDTKLEGAVNNSQAFIQTPDGREGQLYTFKFYEAIERQYKEFLDNKVRAAEKALQEGPASYVTPSLLANRQEVSRLASEILPTTNVSTIGEDSNKAIAAANIAKDNLDKQINLLSRYEKIYNDLIIQQQTLTSNVQTLASSVQNMPTTITHTIGQFPSIEVNVNGTQAFTQLQPFIEQQINQAIEGVVKRIDKASGGQLRI